MQQKVEHCFGCGIAAKVETDDSGKEMGGHPYVAIVAAADVEQRTGQPSIDEPSKRGFVKAPVCTPCHTDPAHRVFPIKGTFFHRKDAEAAKRLAGSHADVVMG